MLLLALVLTAAYQVKELFVVVKFFFIVRLLLFHYVVAFSSDIRCRLMLVWSDCYWLFSL